MSLNEESTTAIISSNTPNESESSIPLVSNCKSNTFLCGVVEGKYKHH